MRRYSAQPLKGELEGITKVFDPDFISAMSRHGCQDDFLICIVGFPRSGTTLTEQILSSHPDVTGLGKRTDFRRAASGLQLKLKSRQPYPRCCSAIKPRHVRELSNTIRAQLCATRPSEIGSSPNAPETVGTSASSRSFFRGPASFTAVGNRSTIACRATCSASPRFRFRRT